MKVTIPEITNQELVGLLKSSGMTDDEVKSFLRRCESKCCCAEKVRILRKTENLCLIRYMRNRRCLISSII